MFWLQDRTTDDTPKLSVDAAGVKENTAKPPSCCFLVLLSAHNREADAEVAGGELQKKGKTSLHSGEHFANPPPKKNGGVKVLFSHFIWEGGRDTTVETLPAYNFLPIILRS